MKIAVGYELIYQFPQPTPMMLMLNVHSSRAADMIVADTMTDQTRSVPISAYRDGFGNWCTPAGRACGAGAHRRRGHGGRCGAAGPGGPGCHAARGAGPAGRDAGLPARQPLLRDRCVDGDRLGAVRQHAAGLGAGAGGVRFRASAYHLRLPAGARHAHGVAGLSGAHRRVPGLCASGAWRSAAA